MEELPILSITTALPLLGAVFIVAFARGDRSSRYIALVFSLVTFAAACLVLGNFDPVNPGFQLLERYTWVESFGLVHQKGVDGISVCFMLLATFLTPICILSAWGGVHARVKDFMMALLVLEAMMIGTFAALDFVSFYIFFEGGLIPMFLIIGIWGGDQRIYAAYKFFLYTLLGSVLMLVAIVVMVLQMGTADMTAMMGQKFSGNTAIFLWLAFLASFAVKTPLWPFHTWLPYAHVEAPTAGSVMLAGVLLKMGGYGFIRISLQMFPETSAFFSPMMLSLGVIAIIYASLVALVQDDLKKLVAYSSVAHMGYVTIGIFSANQQSLDGAMLVMLSHGFVSAALFLCVGVLYERLHTREIARFGGLATGMPRYAFIFMIFMLASIGLPGTSGFVGEFFTLQGTFYRSMTAAILATLGVILGAAYMLWLYRRVFFGPVYKDDVRVLPDLCAREYIMFIPLIVLVVWMGISPAAFLGVFSSATTKTVTYYSILTGGNL